MYVEIIKWGFFEQSNKLLFSKYGEYERKSDAIYLYTYLSYYTKLFGVFERNFLTEINSL